MPQRFQHPAVVYEVLIDRFKRSSAGDDLSAHDADSQADLAERHGGDLYGLIEKLDHIVALGVDTLLLSPVWPAALVTGDQVRDHFEVSAALGGEEAFAALIERCKQLKLRVLLTGIFDRVGLEHPWFVRAKQQQLDDGLVDPSERSRSFFYLRDKPASYAAYHADARRPQLKLTDKALRHKLFHGDHSVLRAWLERGIAGWRIDHAESLGYEILQEIHRAARSYSPNTLIIGDAHNYCAHEVRDGIVDGVVNHHLREALGAFLLGQIPAQELARVLNRQLQAYGFRALTRCFNVLSSPGAPRILDSLGGDRDLLRMAVQMQFVLPGSPLIYYGDELGISGGQKCAARCPMPWDEQRWDKKILNNYKELSRLKRECAALVQGDAVDLTPQGQADVFALARVTGRDNEMVVGVFNRGDQAQQLRLFLSVSGLPDALPMRDHFSDERFVLHNAVLDLTVAPRSARILLPDADLSPHFVEQAAP